MMNRRQALIVIAALALVACGGDDDALLGTLERDRVELVAEAQEPIIEVAVREGDAVTQGQLLLKLDPAAVNAQLAQARATASQAERRLAELVGGPRREQILEARALLGGATAGATAASSEFTRIEKLVGERMLPVSELDRQRASRDEALANERAAKQRLAELERGTRTEVVEQAAAAVEGARAQLGGVELSLARHTVRAPRAGVIDALPYKQGERPPRGAPVAVLLAAGQPYARVFIPEPKRASVKAGSPATVRIDGTDHDWRGVLRYVSSDAAFTPYYALNERDRSRLSFLAEVVLTDPEAAALPTGMPVEVTMLESPGKP
jgi:HlyD family secretion protein